MTSDMQFCTIPVKKLGKFQKEGNFQKIKDIPKN